MDLFGVHIPELQLELGDFREALAAASLQPGETYLELGCGHGRGLVMAASEFEARAIGVDYLPDALQRARRLATKAGVEVELVQDDLMRYDPTDADVILVHLGPAFHDVLAPRLESMLTATTRVVACGWPVPGWLEQWDAFGFPAGYLYRPGDPRQHGEWHVPGYSPHATPGQPLPELSRAAGGTPTIDALSFTAGADLHDVELRITGDLAPRLSARIGATQLGRGQATIVELRWPTVAELEDAPTGDQPRDDRSPHDIAADGCAELQLWARSLSGRFTQRGAGVLLHRR